MDVIKSFGWTYVATVADEGNYGGKGIAAFESLAEKSGELPFHCYSIAAYRIIIFNQTHESTHDS